MGRQDRQALDDEHFIRHQLFGGSGSSGQRYAGLVLAHPSFFSLIRYELLTTLLSPIPGALGLLLRKTMWPALFPQIGKGVVFGCRVTVRHPERIRLGDGVVIDDDVLLDGRGAGDEGIVLGERVIINRGAMIQAKVGGIEIGPDSSIGADVKVISQGAIRIAENVSVAGGAAIAGGRFVVERAAGDDGEKRRFTGGEIRIERSVRIGMNALIQDGVTIGEGAIVAPSSVVVTDVAPNVVVSGFPALPWRERRKPTEPSGLDARAPRKPTTASGSAGPVSENREAPADRAALLDRVRGYFEEYRFAEFGESGLADSDSLFDNDILDSVELVALVAWLEKTFDCEIHEDDLIPDNLDSVERIAQFVHDRSTTRSE